MTVGTIALLLVVMFTDKSPPIHTMTAMPTLQACARDAAAHTFITPPAEIGGHAVASWSVSCVMYVKTVGS